MSADFDKWSPVPSPQVDLQLTPKAADSKADPYIIDVSRTVFSKRYPEMVTLFDSTPVKRKRGNLRVNVHMASVSTSINSLPLVALCHTQNFCRQ